MRPVPLLGSLSLFTFVVACATGTPVGGRLEQVLHQPPPFSPPASPIPIEDAPKAQPTAVAPGPKLDQPAPSDGMSERSRIVEFARESLGRKRIESGGQRFPNDCTGLVLAAYSEVGIRPFSPAKDGDNGVSAIYRYVKSRGRIFRSGSPSPGDLVFFRETYDRNRDGRVNDGLTHIGIVESVDNASTVTIIHRVNRGVVRYRMNLDRPGIHRDNSSGEVLNDYLRPPGQNQPLTLTGQLFEAYGALFASAGRVVATSAH